MKAAHLVGPKRFEIVDAEPPEVRDGNCLVKLERWSVCGSDIRYEYGTVFPEEHYPVDVGTPCHELAGTIVESRSDDWGEGQRVIIIPSTHQGLVEYYESLPDRIIALPDDGELGEWLMCQPSGTVLFALQQVGALLGRTILVIGQGAIGLSFTAMAARAGARRVIAADLFDYRLEYSKKLGATHTINPSNELLDEAVEEITGGELADVTVEGPVTVRFSQEEKLARRLDGERAEIGLFADPASDEKDPRPLKGTYQLAAAGLVFEDDADVDARLVVYGKVYGLAGTDHLRRDLMLALMWGMPVALAFGLLAAVGTSVSTFIVAAIGAWFGGIVDATIQRITEVNLILPVLPILIMVGLFYSRSIWVMLGVLIALSVFSSGIKTSRAVFLQIKESPYFEAARAYGAGNFRIIFLYLIPRLIPTLVPGFVVAIPSFVFVEATLAVLNLGDPLLPTWGKVLSDARVNDALYQGNYYWVLEPAALLLISGLGFSMVGFALDRVFNPRLRDL